MHKLLERQIKKYLQHIEQSELTAFLKAVDDAYEQADKDRLMLERSLELSSNEP